MLKELSIIAQESSKKSVPMKLLSVGENWKLLIWYYR
jgi:hypothetical protein